MNLTQEIIDKYSNALYELDNPEHMERLAEEKAQDNANKTPIGWNIWDKWFGGVKRGELQIIAAPTGQGKTTLLIAMMKRAARTGLKVLYIGVEQKISRFYEQVAGLPVIMIRKTEDMPMEELLAVTKELYDPDLVVYDYLGAESGVGIVGAQEWQVFRDYANKLSEYAIQNNIAILTACQAKNELLIDWNTDKVHTSKYLSYSTSIATKVCAGVYLIKTGNYTAQLKMFKNRDGVFTNELACINLDYKLKEVYDSNEESTKNTKG